MIDVTAESDIVGSGCKDEHTELNEEDCSGRACWVTSTLLCSDHIKGIFTKGHVAVSILPVSPQIYVFRHYLLPGCYSLCM